MKAYKYKIRKPSKRVVERFEQTLEICRELYNAALQERRDAWRVCRKPLSFYEQCLELTEVRAIRPDVEGIHNKVSRDPLMRVDKAFKAFFKRAKTGAKGGYPRFKNKARYNSFTYVGNGHRLEGNKLILSKIGSVRLHLSRSVEGKVKTCTIKKQIDGWFIIFIVEENQSPYIPKTGESVGIDVGLENFATLSNGETIENPRYLRKAEREIKIAQRKLSKKKRNGSNRKKAVYALAKKHQKVVNRRRDFFHKLSNQLIQRFDEIAVEDLNIAGLVKNHHLAKSISDAAWNTFLRTLTRKAESAGRRVWKVAPQFTSQDCSNCGGRVKKSLAIREHRCSSCGYAAHRDVNAAVNIKGRAVPLGMGKVTNPSEPRIFMNEESQYDGDYTRQRPSRY